MAQLKILIVDDDDGVREALYDELCMGFDVDSAASGEEAVAMMTQSGYDAVISDLRMPGMNGISVLEEAHKRHPNAVRILLTGFYDEQARRALRQPDAPYKVGKPWHDEVEVTLARAFEQRESTHKAAESMQDALDLVGFDDALGAAKGLFEMARLLAARIEELHGVRGVVVCVDKPERTVAGNQAQFAEAEREAAWVVERELVESTTVRVGGDAGPSRPVVTSLIDRACLWAREDNTTRLARKAAVDEGTRDRLRKITRWASLGAMMSTLMHDMATVVQGLDYSVSFLEDCLEDIEVKSEELDDAMSSVQEFSRRMSRMFHATRGFVRSGQVNRTEVDLSEIVSRSMSLSRRHLGTTKVSCHQTAGVRIRVNEPLYVQVLVNLLRNAAAASPPDGVIDIEVRSDDTEVEVAVIDDGPGVPEHIVDALFEPLSGRESGDGSGLGLAISSEIVKYHHGTIQYQREPGRGARFTVVVPARDPDEEVPLLVGDAP